MKSRKFIDSVVLYARAGNGGNGCASFRREKYVPRGGPDGGDGGRGGDVILRARHDEDSLIGVYFSPHRAAENGGHGRNRQLHGRNGRDLIIRVPCGTEVWNSLTGEMAGEVVNNGDQLVIARGGKGGLGNCHWKSSTHRAPLEYTKGEPGAEITFRLELKLVADIGLVGFPNAGKSSLLSVISHAHPKIAAYPFTTLNPMIGTVQFDDGLSVKVADIPGLLKGAHEGIGLGFEFLRHIERAPALVFVIDMSGFEGRKPHEDYSTLCRELELYDKDLLSRPSIIVANKMDIEGAEAYLKTFRKETGKRPHPVSALTRAGIDKLIPALHKLAARMQKHGAQK